MRRLWCAFGAVKALLLFLVCILSSVDAHATYRLQRVTSVSAGNHYVFEQCGKVMGNSISSNALQVINSFAVCGLVGNESYVWQLKSATDDFKMLNINQGKYLKFASTNLSWGDSSTASVWNFTLQTDGTFLIRDKNLEYFLGYADVADYRYKSYPLAGKGAHPHSVIVYQLVEETATSPSLTFDQRFVMTTKGADCTFPILSKDNAYPGTITYSSTNEQVATVNPATGAVQVVGVGRTLIVASAPATDGYDAAEAVYTLVVMGGDGTEDSPYTVDDFFTGYTPDYGSNRYVKGYLAGYYTPAPSIRLLTTASDDSNVALASSLSGASLDNTIPVALEGDVLPSSFGLYSHPELYGCEVVVKGNLGIFSQKVTIQSAAEITLTACPATITSAQYATTHSPYTLDYSGTGITPYTARLGDGCVVLTPVADGIVPANRGIILYSETPGTFAVPVADGDATISDTGLKISNGVSAVGSGIYVLGNKNSELGFYRWVGAESLSAGRVYLDASAAGAPEYLEMVISDGDLSAVCPLRVASQTATVYYDLQGRRISAPRRGLYIVGGKKVVVNDGE